MGWERLSIHSFLDSIYSTGVSPTDKDRYKYGYDRNSNRQWRQNVVGSGQNLDEYYTYDNLNRLTVMQRGTLTGSPFSGISGTPVAEQDWTLDATGNWNGFVVKASGTTTLNQSRTQNKVNEITAITASTGTDWADPAYDAAGNMTTMPKPSSLANSYTATYDAWNRMIQVKDGGTTIATYSYDGRNRRIKVDTAVVRHFYFTNSWQDVEERLGSLTTADRQYVWGIRYIDELVCRDRLVGGSSSSSSSSSSGGGGLNERLYACQDANFNVTSLIDTSGNVEERYTYDPYATPTFRNASWADIGSSAKASNILYAGYKYDTGTGLYYVRFRYLHAALGKWGQRDLIGYYNSMNLYSYAISSPIGNIDPTGLAPQDRTKFDDYWEQFKKAHPGLTKEQLDWAFHQLIRGCVGVVCSALGKDILKKDPKTGLVTSNLKCYKTKALAEKEQNRTDEAVHCGCQIFSIHLWNDTGYDKNKPDLSFDGNGRADLTNWDSSARPGGGYTVYDFGWLAPDGTIWHADTYHNPDKKYYPDKDAAIMTVQNSTLAQWQKGSPAQYQYPDFNAEVWCVACPGKYE